MSRTPAAHPIAHRKHKTKPSTSGVGRHKASAVVSSDQPTIAQPSSAPPQSGAVLRWLHESGPRSRNALSDELGLSRSTLGLILADLQVRGLVRPTGIHSSGGRPATIFAADGSRVAGVGAVIHDGQISAAAITLAGDVAATRHETLAGHDTTSALTRLAQHVQAVASEARRAGVEPIGTTLAYDEHAAHGPAGDHQPFAGTTTAALHQLLEPAELPAPMSVVSLSEAAAEAEARHDSDPENHALQDALVILTGSRLRALVVKDGRLLRGAQGIAGSLEHMPVGHAGQPCGCGLAGCWSTMVSPHALGVGNGPWDRDVVADIRTRVLAGDRDAHAAIRQAGYWLGVGAAVLTQLIQPHRIVVGGAYAPLGPFMQEAFLDGLRSANAAPPADPMPITFSSLGPEAAVRGAAHHAAHAVLHDPSLAPRQLEASDSSEGA